MTIAQVKAAEKERTTRAARKRAHQAREASARIACDYCGMTREQVDREQDELRAAYYERQARRAA